MLRLTIKSESSFSTLTLDENKEIKDSKHSPVYRKRGAEGFSPLFSFLFVYLNNMKSRANLSLQTLLLLIGLVAIPTFSNAQVKGIIDFAAIDEDNTVLGYSATCTTHVKFISSITNNDTMVNGNLIYWYQTDSMAAVDNNWYEYIDDNPFPEFIPIGGQFDLFPFFCDSSQLRTGPVNVIIIWPSLISATTPMVDSGMYVIPNVYVGTTIGIEEEGLYNYGSTVFPNPAQSMQLVFINSKYSKEIGRVTVVNAMGQVMNSREFNEYESSQGYIVPTDDLRAGIYNIQIFYKDNKTEVVKFIKN